MKIVIVGGGASGLVCALALKDKNAKYDVTVIDRNNKLGKKLRATGNGKCNMFNSDKNAYLMYRHTDASKSLFSEITPEILTNFFAYHNVYITNYGPYVYPYSESANMFTDTLISEGKKLGVKYIDNTNAMDYKNNKLITDNGEFMFDKLVIASGLGSAPQLGGDEKFVKQLSKHGYDILPIHPTLLPIKTQEKTKPVEGRRRKVIVKVFAQGKCKFKEDGELLFKKDGLSGIVIYHAASIILRNNLTNPEIVVDFIPNKNFDGNWDAYFTSDLANYLRQFGNPKNVKFHLAGYYDAKESVASVGGVSLKNVDSFFESKIEKNVFIIGEALDQDGLCGGYNLMWAFSSAIKSAKKI